MPEYLAPAVYVEEIDTGNKPIEGVSTSTTGMVGVTERGPVNVPVLVTSYGEYVRWFGERLNPGDYLDHRFLPHAVEGFFTNGGKRLFVVRVLETAQAQAAETFLFDRNAAAAGTRLLRGAAAGVNNVYVADAGAVAVNDWVRIGAGSAAEYAQVTAVPLANAVEVPLRQPLAVAHAAGSAVRHLNPAPAAGGAGPFDLTAAVAGGDLSIVLNDVTGLNAGDLVRIGTAVAGDEEYVFIDAPVVATNTVPLRTPLVLPHPAQLAAVQQMTPGTVVAADDRTVAAGADAHASDAMVFLAPDRNGYTTRGDFVRIEHANPNLFEVRRIGELGEVPLSSPAYADYPTGSLVEPVQFADVPGPKNLQQDASAGTNVLHLDDRQGLDAGDIVRIGMGIDPNAEYAVIRDVPDRRPSPDAGIVVLTATLQTTHSGTQVQEQTVQTSTPGARATVLAASRNADSIVVSDGDSLAGGAFVRVTTGANVFYHRLDGPAVGIAPAPVTLANQLALPHDMGSSVVVRTPLLRVSALDAGRWGGRLRLVVQDNDPPLVRSRIRSGGIQDSTHIRLESAHGIEPGTILQWTDGGGGVHDLKVIGLDRQNDYLIELDNTTQLPNTAADGDAIRSREFQLDVLLLPQPDPAVPTRGETALASESFRYLSMDPRHSRYVHKIIGTTWNLNSAVTQDDDNRPLRRSDRRSEGSSWYIRIRDLAPANTVRLGPEPLTDRAPSGPPRPARQRFATRGNDAIGAIGDLTYIGNPDPNPELRTGFYALENVEEISIVGCPGRTGPILQDALISHCERMRYRFAVLDGPPPPSDSLEDVRNLRQQFDTKYAAVYHPWLLIPEPFPVNLTNVPDYPIPPSGHVLGVYARTDIDRGVHKAPANEVVRGITGLSRILNKSEHDILNPYPVNINVVRDFRDNNRGIRVYGGRVITSDPDWKYVNVRRLVIFIEQSIDRGLQWVVFEPNAEPLWARLRRAISNFLTTVWRNGALEGTKVEEAYFVKCDRTTMTQTDIDNGRLICVVGIAPVKPAEFVIVRIGLWTAHADN